MTAAGTRRDQRGQVGGIEGLIFGVLVFVFGTLLVTNAWGVVDAKLAASAAAREAARTYVESGASADAETQATVAARQAIEGHRRDWARAELQLTGQGFGRCARITATVAYEAPLMVIPLLGQHGTGFTVTARHSEVVDPYRSGLSGPARCAG